MNRLNLSLVTLTSTTFTAIAYVVCAAFRVLFPDMLMYEVERWGAMFPGFSWTLGGVALGLIEAMLYAYFSSALFVSLYNFFARRSERASI